MGGSDTIEVIDGLDSDSTTGFNIFQHFRHWEV